MIHPVVTGFPAVVSVSRSPMFRSKVTNHGIDKMIAGTKITGKAKVTIAVKNRTG